jgi:hypothetical protein
MNVKLKKDFNLDVLLVEIHKIKKLSTDNDKANGGILISFKSSEVYFIDSIIYNKIVGILMSVLGFNTQISEFSKGQIIRHSINDVAINNINNDKLFIKCLNQQYNNYYIGKQQKGFNLLCSLSVDRLPFDTFNVGESELLFPGNVFPPEFVEFREKQYLNHYEKKEETEFLKIVIRVKERDFQDALEKTYGYLEVLRAFITLQINSSTWSFSLTNKSINEILIGDFLTLHHDDGTLADDFFYWFESNSRKLTTYKIDNEESMSLT